MVPVAHHKEAPIDGVALHVVPVPEDAVDDRPDAAGREVLVVDGVQGQVRISVVDDQARRAVVDERLEALPRPPRDRVTQVQEDGVLLDPQDQVPVTCKNALQGDRNDVPGSPGLPPTIGIDTSAALPPLR